MKYSHGLIILCIGILCVLAMLIVDGLRPYFSIFVSAYACFFFILNKYLEKRR